MIHAIGTNNIEALAFIAMFDDLTPAQQRPLRGLYNRFVRGVYGG